MAQETLADIGEVFAMFSPNFMAQGRELHEEPARDWSSMGMPNAKAVPDPRES